MFDLSNVELNKHDLIPPGEYTVAVEEAELIDTKSGNGQAIKAVFVITDGEHKGRKIFHYFNVRNSSEIAQTIGLQQLKSFLVAAGWKEFRFASPTELEGHKATVLVRHDDNQVIIVGFKRAPRDTSLETPF